MVSPSDFGCFFLAVLDTGSPTAAFTADMRTPQCLHAGSLPLAAFISHRCGLKPSFGQNCVTVEWSGSSEAILRSVNSWADVSLTGFDAPRRASAINDGRFSNMLF